VSEQPSRYTRSFGGMIGALVVTVLFVLAFVAWRGLFRGDAEVTPEPVEWQERVELAEEAGLTVVHPRELPAGWIATSTELSAGDDPRWGLGVLTAEGDFIGIREQDASVEELVRTYVDEKAEAGDDATVPSAVADTWQTWSDEGGDHAYATELGDEVVLVYGSAPVAEIETYIGLLTH
jgi:Protein of unknown function (DUF4245)